MKQLNTAIKHTDKITIKIFDNFERNRSEKLFDIKDAVVIGLLEEMIGKSKSAQLLIANNQNDGLDSIVRSIFESFVYLKFILLNDTNTKAKAYFYSGKISENRYCQQLLLKDKKGDRLRNYLGVNLMKVVKVLEKENFEENKIYIENEYMETIGKNDIRQKWYNLDGNTRSIETLCRKVNMEIEYDLIYRLLSKDVHSTKAYQRVKMKKGEISVILPNSSKSMSIGLTSYFLIEAGRYVLEEYRMKKELAIYNANIRLSLK